MKLARSWPFVIVCGAVLTSLPLVSNTRLCGQGGDAGQSILPAASESFTFRLELYGDKVADYNECCGLGSSNDIEEAVVQSNGVIVKQKTPGALEWHNITLRRVGPSSEAVWSWRKAMEMGDLKGAIRDGTIIMYREGSEGPLARWDFRNGWAARLKIEGSMEELTIVHEGLERVDTTDGAGTGPRGR